MKKDLCDPKHNETQVIQDIQSLKGKLTTMDQFLAKLTRKSLQFFKILGNKTRKLITPDTKSTLEIEWLEESSECIWQFESIYNLFHC